ncbi:MAG: helix-turn-helix domain-containing protein [Planctomycetota bacterium]|jgi:transcriptional regulator with XRE-family HTH domain
MARRKRIHRKYTRIGRRIAELGRQVDLAKALGMSQQTVSKKLRGECAILLSDLERLAMKYNLSLTWFFEGYGRKDLPSDKVKVA